MLNKRIETVFNRFRLFLVVSAIMIVILNVSACSKQQIVVPTVTPEPTHMRFPGKFVWFDLFTQDLQSAERFYGALFGWSFQDTASGGNKVKTIVKNGVPIANAVYLEPQADKKNTPRWLSYMSVENVDQASTLAEQNKGSIYMPPKDLPARGRVAVVIDPEGAIFAIVTTSEGDPPDQDYIENHWISSELWTTDPDRALQFYDRLVGYELRLINVGADSTYNLLVRNDQPRAGMVKIPWDDVEPSWVPYIAVADAPATAEKAVLAGGKLLVEPDVSIREGRLAIIADPSGAVFAIQELSEMTSGGGTQP